MNEAMYSRGRKDTLSVLNQVSDIKYPIKIHSNKKYCQTHDKVSHIIF